MLSVWASKVFTERRAMGGAMFLVNKVSKACSVAEF